MFAEVRLLSIPSKAVWALMMAAGAAATGAAVVLVRHTIECLQNPAATVSDRVIVSVPTVFIVWGTLTLVAAFVEQTAPRGFYLMSGRLMAGSMFAYSMCLAALLD